jgi:hypothetical protein
VGNIKTHFITSKLRNKNFLRAHQHARKKELSAAVAATKIDVKYTQHFGALRFFPAEYNIACVFREAGRVNGVICSSG